MKRFVWRLQRVLEIRAKEEQTKRAELIKIMEKLAETRGQLLAQQRILSNMISCVARQAPRKRLSEQEFFLKYSLASEEQIRMLKNRASELESQQRQAMMKLLELKKSKEGLERLRAEAKRRFIEEQEKVEQKELNEIAGISFARERNSVCKYGSDRLGE
jgi:flagellar FliJ protein